MLFIQADGGLRAIFLFVKQAEKLPVILPVPPSVAYMDKSFVLDLARDLAERGERIGRWRTFGPKLFFLRQPKHSDSSKNFEPRQKEPGRRGHQTEGPVVSNKIDGEKRGAENSEGAGLLRIRILKTP